MIAINSMFKWYKHSAVCFAWLVDMPSEASDLNATEPEDTAPGLPSSTPLLQSLSICAWFKRGWTLQELIAPKTVLFYDSEWNLLGSKADLVKEISIITRIDTDVLLRKTKPRELPVACRMSWAADRHTTRTEDMAYCLLGIFDINMALLYGEGGRAFIRLQEEICRQSTDLSLFAWRAESSDGPWQRYRGIFAHSPFEFRDCNEFIALPKLKLRYEGEFAVTNRGLRLDGMPLYTGVDSGILMALDCMDEQTSSSANSQTAISLTKTMDGYVRSSPDKLFDLSYHYLPGDHNPGTRHENARIYISKELSKQEYLQIRRSTNELLEIRVPSSHVNTTRIFAAEPKDLWDPSNRTFFSVRENPFFAVHVGLVSDMLSASTTEEFIFVCGLNDPPHVAHSRWSRDLVYAGFTPRDPEWKPMIKNINDGLFQSSEVQQWVRTLLIRTRDIRLARGEPADTVTVPAGAMRGVLTGDLVSGPTSRRFVLSVDFISSRTPST